MSRHLRERKARDSSMVQTAVGIESAMSDLSSNMPQMEQSAISQLKKRTPSPTSSGDAFLSAQEGASSESQTQLKDSSNSGSMVESIDKVAFPMNPNGPGLPKVEEDFNVQETGDSRKFTSIKNFLPSHLPRPGAVKVMAASAKEQNDASVPSGVPSPGSGQPPPIADFPNRQNDVAAENYAGISLTENVQLDQNNNGPSFSPDQASQAVPESPSSFAGEPMAGGDGRGPGVSLTENVQLDQNNNSPSFSPDQASQAVPESPSSVAGGPMAGGDGRGPISVPGPGSDSRQKEQMAVSAFLTDQHGSAGQSPASGGSFNTVNNAPIQNNFAQTSQDQLQGVMPENSRQMSPNVPQSPPLQTPPERITSAGSSGHQPVMGSNQGQGGEVQAGSAIDHYNGVAGGSMDQSHFKSRPMPEEVLEEQSNVKILMPYSGQAGADGAASEPIAYNNQKGSFNMPNQMSSGHALSSAGEQNMPLSQPPANIGRSQKGDVLPPLRSSQSTAGKERVKIEEDVSVSRGPSSSSASANPVAPSRANQLPEAPPVRPQFTPALLHAGDAQVDASADTLHKEGSSKVIEQLDTKSQFTNNVGQQPGTFKSHVQVHEEKLGDKPGTSDLFDDPSALKREMPSENRKASLQPESQPQGNIIPGRQNVQITSESISRIIKNPSRHRSAISDPSGIDLPELLRPPGFGPKYSGFGVFSTVTSMKSSSPPPKPQPSISRLTGSIDMKSNINAARSAIPQTPNVVETEAQPPPNNAPLNVVGSHSESGESRPRDLTTKLSETLRMVDTVLGPPPFKPKREFQASIRRNPYLDTMDAVQPGSLEGRTRKRASESEPANGDLGINLTVLINNDPADSTPSNHTAASAGAAANIGRSAFARRPAKEDGKNRIFNSLKGMAFRKESRGRAHAKRKGKQSAKETKIKDLIEVKTLAAGDSSEVTYDYDISQLPAWMKNAVKDHLESSH